MHDLFTAVARWPRHRWVAAAVAAGVTLLVLGLPTDVIPNPVFGRQGTPVEPWAYPVLVLTALGSGLLFATYVRLDGGDDTADPAPDRDRPGTLGGLGGLVSFFAIGCPICNKVVVLALGTSGALRWFAPVQPYLGIVSLGLVTWALLARLRGEIACPVRV